MSFPAQKIIVHVLFAIFGGNAHGPLDMLTHAISTALLLPAEFAIALQIHRAGDAAPATARAT